MENFIVRHDMKVLCITATSFPEGIQKAHETLHAHIPFSAERKYFGLSRPENGVIIYKAAAEEKKAGEAENLGCETIVIKSGQYICLTVVNFMDDIPAIGKAFRELLTYPGLDPEGYCVEWYLNEKDVKCMIRIK
jgi:predicted transcriptional regulator YdeE